MMKVYLDDERETPEGWFRVYEPKQAIALLKTGQVTHISLDHDLGDDELIGTGYDVVLWMEEAVVLGKFTPPKINVHSANPAGSRRMRAGIKQIRKLYAAKCNHNRSSSSR
jgi:hypothetical protein